MILNFQSLYKKPFIKNIFHAFPKFSFREHLKFDINQPKAYRRILPAAQKLMKIHKISEEDLPDLRIIKKEHILNIVQGREKDKLQVEKQAEAVIPKGTSPKKEIVYLFDEVSSNKEIDYIFIKNKLPHSYYYLTANVERLLTYLPELNKNHNKNIKLEDFISKIVAKLISKNNKLQILFDQTGNKFINYQNVRDVHVYLKNLQKATDEHHVYINPHTYAIAEVAKSKKNLKEFKEKYTPIIRLFNYSELDVLRADELIVPPALLSLSFSKVFNRLVQEEEKITHAKHLNLTLTGVATVFQEDTLTILLEDIVRHIEQPLTISL